MESTYCPQQFISHRYTVSGAVDLGDTSYPWSQWDGQRLRKHIAIDTETDVVTGPTVPELAMIGISDGAQHFVMVPRDLPGFLMMHLPAGHHLIAHKFAFDFWVIDRYLAQTGHHDARNWMWSAADGGRIHDTMLLAALISLAERDSDVMVNLDVLAQRYCGYSVPKDNPFRLRFAETRHTPWPELETGFFDYCVADPIATYQAYCRMTAVAKQLCGSFGVTREHGFLTESIQVKAAIALAAIHRTGMCLDEQKAQELLPEIDRLLHNCIDSLQEYAGPKIFHRYKRTGKVMINKQNGLPKKNKKGCLVPYLSQLADELGIEVPLTKTGQHSTAIKDFWADYRDDHPFIEVYCHYEELVKLRSFFKNLNKPRIHPRYRTLVRSGRTSCSQPNIQQLPRDSSIRDVIIPTPGYLFVNIDYSTLELVTLARVCEARYGFSRLADVLREGIDPHANTAAMFADVSLEEFSRLKGAKQLRQQAKAINFGIPGGLGARTLVQYARSTYHVTISQEQAAEFRTKLIEQVYPELQRYLSEDSASVLARSLAVDAVRVRHLLPNGWQFGVIRKVVTGKLSNAKGEPYSQTTIDRVWKTLAQLNNNPELAAAIGARDDSETSPLRRLMYSPASTITGRIRNNVSFTAGRNTPFQGLAADGCKLAMWDLIKAGYRVAGFIHDEFLVEISKLDDVTKEAVNIERICCSAMQQLVGDIPVKCEYALADRWRKGAEAVFDERGTLLVWQPTGGESV